MSDLTVKAQYVRRYTVTFADHDGNVLATEIVNRGDDANPPAEPSREGYSFISWDQSYINIVSDMKITAVYQLNRYTVKFMDVDGSLLETKSNVPHGRTITAPQMAEMYFNWDEMKGYRFKGWKNWNETMPIVSNMTILADYSEEITEPIIAIESTKINKGTTTAEVSVYLCGSFAKIHGMSLKLKYAEQLRLTNKAVTVSSKLLGNEATLNTEKNLYELSWADGKGMEIKGKLEILTLAFTVDKRENVGEYLVELLDGTYIIDSALSKDKPIVIVGNVTIEG